MDDFCMNDIWLSYPEQRPVGCVPCLVHTTNNPEQAYVACYFDGDFYRLEYDDTVGTLRKTVVNNVFEYSNIYSYDQPVA